MYIKVYKFQLVVIVIMIRFLKLLKTLKSKKMSRSDSSCFNSVVCVSNLEEVNAVTLLRDFLLRLHMQENMLLVLCSMNFG